MWEPPTDEECSSVRVAHRPHRGQDQRADHRHGAENRADNQDDRVGWRCQRHPSEQESRGEGRQCDESEIHGGTPLVCVWWTLPRRGGIHRERSALRRHGRDDDAILVDEATRCAALAPLLPLGAGIETVAKRGVSAARPLGQAVRVRRRRSLPELGREAEAGQLVLHQVQVRHHVDGVDALTATDGVGKHVDEHSGNRQIEITSHRNSPAPDLGRLELCRTGVVWLCNNHTMPIKRFANYGARIVE